MDNRKGQLEGIGMIIFIMIVALVGLVLFQAMAPIVAGTRDTYTAFNHTFTPPASNVTIDLPGQEVFGTPIVKNASDNTVIAAGNYTIDERVSEATGVKTVSYTTAGSGTEILAGTGNYNVTYEYANDGYIDSSGGRAIAGLIMLFMAIAIALVVLVPTVRNKILDFK